MKEFKQKAQNLIDKHLPFAKTWDCYWDEPSKEKNEIKSAIQSVNHAIYTLKKLKKVMAYKVDALNIEEAINEQIELKKILEGRL